MLASFFLAAFVVTGAVCDLFDPSLVRVPGAGHLVVTNFDDGSSRIDCRGQVEGIGVKLRFNHANTDAWCFAGRDYSADWQETIQADGEAHLWCRLVGKQ